MPMRWDDQAHATLLLKILEQSPDALSKANAKAGAIAESWPGQERPTSRAVIEQLKKIKKKVAATTTSSTSTTSATPETPTKKTSTPSSSSSKKRRVANTHSTLTESATKRRRVKSKKSKTVDDIESEAPNLTSSDDETAGNHETDEDDLPTGETTLSIKRALSARSKSRTKSYTVDADSAGEDDGAKDPHSEEDGEFSLHDKGKNSRNRSVKTDQAGDDGRRARDIKEEDQHEDENDEEDGEEEDCDTASQTTGHQTFYSTLEEF